jgi:calcineurin-like phosphoesterase family protein
MRNYNVFFTSDTHFGHKNLLKIGKGRPFSNIKEHDEALINNWNSVVKPNDIVFHLGDVSLCYNEKELAEIFKKLNGHKHIIVGNHDRQKLLAYSLNLGLIQSMRTYHEYKYEGDDGKIYTFIMMHWPILEPNHIFRNKDHNEVSVIGLYGHIHHANNYDEIYKSLNFPCVHVGVDTSSNVIPTNPYTPINAEHIIDHCNNIFFGDK